MAIIPCSNNKVTALITFHEILFVISSFKIEMLERDFHCYLQENWIFLWFFLLKFKCLSPQIGSHFGLEVET